MAANACKDRHHAGKLSRAGDDCGRHQLILGYHRDDQLEPAVTAELPGNATMRLFNLLCARPAGRRRTCRRWPCSPAL